MRILLTRLFRCIVAMSIAGTLWLLILHFFFHSPASAFRSTDGLSPKARALAARHLHLWTDSQLREQELQRMRASNAEWDFMGRSFLVWSLANIGLREPAQKSVCLETMDRIIAETLRLEQSEGIYFFLMSYARATPYVVQPPRSLFIDGEIALMIATRRMLEEREEYKPLLSGRIKVIADGMRRGPNLALESYPNECWTFDHCVALAAVRLADRLDGTDHAELIRDWLTMARRRLIHPDSGLLVSSFTTDGQQLDGPEGSTLWMVAHCLQLLDEPFARDQYERARRQLGEITLGFGYAHEWPAVWTGPADIDSGPIVPFFNISAGSSGMALIGASAFADEDFLGALATTLDFAAFPSKQGDRLKYCASNQVGDAALLYAATLGPLWVRAGTGGAK